MENVEFIENIGDNVVKGKSPANMKGIKGKKKKVPTKAELKECSSLEISSSTPNKADNLNGM